VTDDASLDTTVGTQAPTGTPRFPRPSRPPSSHSGSTTVGSPLEALERDEILRTRRFCIIATAIALAGVLAVPLLPGDPTAAALVVIAVAMSLVAIAFLWSRTSDPIAFRQRSTALAWFVPAVSVSTAIPFFGVFSPAPLLLVLGIYFTGLGKSRALASGIYAVCAGAQLLVAILVISGAMRDTGIVRANSLATSDKVLIQLLVQVVLLGTYVTARLSRRTALVAVGELERAVRLAAHREALLLEAREELERALRAGRGRFSDQTIGTYQIGTLIGRGAMGEVYAATDARGKQVAIKLLSQTSLSNPNHVRRFLRELQHCARLDSPHIVKVLEVGESPVPYLVMEKLEGQTLGEILRGKRALRVEEVVDMVRQVGIGITAAAAAGIIHRDLKPQNVFNDRHTWKILDFGVSRGADHGDTLTSGGVVGTPSYMAPEQASGGTVDHCTDLYALAAIAYRASTGHPPFAAGEIAETLYRVVHTAPRRPTDIATDLHADLDLALAIGLAKRPEHRFTSAHELAEALADAFVGALPASLRDRGEVLVRNGAWAGESKRTRATTSRMRHR
jgi:eukaryotic-like serine/threonine-protein kinase